MVPNPVADAFVESTWPVVPKNVHTRTDVGDQPPYPSPSRRVTGFRTVRHV